jgi:hypothetical protein
MHDPQTEELVTRIVSSVLRELGYGEAIEPTEPEWMPDRDINRTIVKVGRTKYWQLTKDPSFPQGIRIGRDMFRRPREVRAWLASFPAP